jgi:hypothetical protein
MAIETDVPQPPSAVDSPWRSIAVFLALTIVLSGILWAFINLTQAVTAVYVFALMWMPGIAAMLTCRIVGRPLSSLGLGRWNGKFVLIGYLIPIGYCLVASLGTWVFGFGGFPTGEFVQATADTMGLGGAPSWVVIALFVVLSGTTGKVAGVGAAAGEEIGWRGLLVPELARVLPHALGQLEFQPSGRSRHGSSRHGGHVPRRHRGALRHATPDCAGRAEPASRASGYRR